jgi:archaellum component FlaC
MTIAVEDLKSEEFAGFIRNMVRSELVNLTHELPKHTFEALLLQQIFDKLNNHDRMFVELKQEMNERFEQVDRRFDRIDQRFEKVDQRLEQVDRRFDQVDQRLDRMDQRFDQVDQRFDQVDQRFKRIDEQFGG